MMRVRHFMGSNSVRGARALSLRAHETARESRQGWNRTGPQETAVIRAHAAVVLGETKPEKCGDVEVVADRFRARHGEIVVLHAVAHVTGDAHSPPAATHPPPPHH